MSADRQNDYLWDRSGPPDPEIVRLEALLDTLRHDGRRPELHRADARNDAAAGFSRRRAGRALYVASGIAATLVVMGVAAAAWVTLVQPRIGWSVQSLAGAPIVDGRAVEGSARLGIGRWLTTGDSARARIAVGQIGRVDVEPNTHLQLVESRGREHRITLAEGTIHARIWAPPKFFYVNTPSAVAVDLGCAYTLQVHPDGSGLVRVTHGWVGFEHGGREAFIPEQAMCATRPGIGPGTPQYEDASAAFAGALAILDFGAADDRRRPEALDCVLSEARRRDALTLWHLLQRGASAERARVYDRMATLAPPPAGVSRDAVLAGDRNAIDLWWGSLGLDSATWWRLWKKKW
jgi:hypothetical protein